MLLHGDFMLHVSRKLHVCHEYAPFSYQQVHVIDMQSCLKSEVYESCMMTLHVSCKCLACMCVG
jgi:hypothetical protein